MSESDPVDVIVYESKHYTYDFKLKCSNIVTIEEMYIPSEELSYDLKSHNTTKRESYVYDSDVFKVKSTHKLPKSVIDEIISIHEDGDDNEQRKMRIGASVVMWLAQY